MRVSQRLWPFDQRRVGRRNSLQSTRMDPLSFSRKGTAPSLRPLCQPVERALERALPLGGPLWLGWQSGGQCVCGHHRGWQAHRVGELRDAGILRRPSVVEPCCAAIPSGPAGECRLRRDATWYFTNHSTIGTSCRDEHVRRHRSLRLRQVALRQSRGHLKDPALHCRDTLLAPGDRQLR